MSLLETTLLLATFITCLSIVYSSLRTGITPVPSSAKARHAILSAADRAPPGTIIELGSGWGTLALALAKRYPEQQVIGYELSPIPWLVSKLRQRLQRLSNLSLRRKNFLSNELPQATLLVCYLYPRAMELLADKLRQEQTKPQLLISNTFALPNSDPEQIIRLDDIYKSPIYLYRIGRPGKEVVKANIATQKS